MLISPLKSIKQILTHLSKDIYFLIRNSKKYMLQLFINMNATHLKHFRNYKILQCNFFSKNILFVYSFLKIYRNSKKQRLFHKF